MTAGPWIPRLHAVTDQRVLSDPEFASGARAVVGVKGEGVLHLRGHDASGRHLNDLVLQLARDVASAGWALIVNDRVDVALARRLPGVHLAGHSLGPEDARALLGVGRLLGVSVHDMDEADRAHRSGADYLVLGSIFDTPSHPRQARLGLKALASVAEAIPIPVVAIGGITPERVRDCLEAGAHGVAVLSGIWRTPDLAAATAGYHRYLKDWRSP